jgi:hypothetical protein
VAKSPGSRSIHGQPIERLVITSSRLSGPWRGVALVLAVPLLASGCAAGSSDDFGSERKVVAEFFELLASGETSGIAALITDDSALISAVLDDDFYAAATDRPADAKVVAATASEPGSVFVTVEYSVGGDDRDIKVEVVGSDGDPKIAGWLHETLSIDPMRAPGVWEVNGTLSTGETEEETQFVALPGVYEFEYVDPQGLGTVDPDGEATSSFAVEFPVERGQLTATVPPGVEALGPGIGVEPRLLDTAEDSVDTQLATLVDECTASGLVGDSCPAALVSAARAGGVVDTNTVVWTATSEAPVSPSAQWDLGAEYSVAFNRVDAAGRDVVDAAYAGVLGVDAGGNPVLELAG